MEPIVKAACRGVHVLKLRQRMVRTVVMAMARMEISVACTVICPIRPLIVHAVPFWSSRCDANLIIPEIEKQLAFIKSRDHSG
jgi:hypothetical protein